MNIALTGITGMVGSHFIKKLLENDSKGSEYNIKALIRENSVVEHLKAFESIDYIIGGLEDKESLGKLVQDADILIHEVFVGLDHDPVRMSVDTIENISDYHTTPEEIGVLASNANVKKLILNHFVPPVFDEDVLVERIAKHFDGEIVVGKDLMQFDI